MIIILDILILLLVVVTAIASLEIKDLLCASMYLSIFSFVVCLLYASMGAVDVAFTEAAVGAGVSTVLLIATILKTSRKTRD